LALKRVAVNNEQDLYLCRQEIAIMKALSDSNYSVTYMGSQINRLSKDVYEVLILMQLYGGQSGIQLLRQYHSQGKILPEELILKIFTSICQAVARLHHRTKPIIHRDLKIENILQDFSGNFVLCDYGSCTTQDIEPLTYGVQQCEDQLKKFTTLPYRSPEMVDLYSGHVISTKADIWALGCLLYKLCFFDTPFGEQSLAIMRGTFSFPDNSTSYSPSLLNLIRYMLNVTPTDRPDIYQVSWVAFKLLGRETPIVNVFNSPKPSILESGPVQLVKPKAAKTKSLQVVSSEVGGGASPRINRTNSPLVGQVTVTSISSRERPRPRPLSTVGATPVHSTSSSSSPSLRSKSNEMNTPKSSPQVPRPSSGKATNNGIESVDQSTSSPSQPTQATDDFGHIPFSERDIFGAVPFNTAVKQVT
jgi:AP2-associated kinase